MSGKGNQVGGVVGYNYAYASSSDYSPLAAIYNCYSVGTVTGRSCVGGVAGENYASGSTAKATVTNCYYLVGTAAGGINGADVAGRATALTDEQMRTEESFIGFDFDVIWEFGGVDEGYYYPTLTGNVTKIFFTVTFYDYDGTQIGEPQKVEKRKSATAPDMSSAAFVDGAYVYVFDHWNTSFARVTADLTVTAVYAKTAIIYYRSYGKDLEFRWMESLENVETYFSASIANIIAETTNDYTMVCKVEWSEEDIAKLDNLSTEVQYVRGTLTICDSLYYEMAAGAAVQVQVQFIGSGEAVTEGDFTSVVNDDLASVTITGYTGTATNVVIPETIQGLTVTAIAEGALRGNTTMQELSVSKNVTSIGSEAFAGCDHLVNVNLPEGLQTIDAKAFHGCSMTSVTILSDTVTIGEQAFGYADAGVIGGFTVFGHEGSTAQAYAEANSGILFAGVSSSNDIGSGVSAVVEAGNTITAEEITDEATHAAAAESLPATEDYVLYDINLYDAEGEKTQPNNNVLVSVPLPQGYDAARCGVLRLNSDGSTLEMYSYTQGSNICFYTNHFSVYVISEYYPEEQIMNYTVSHYLQQEDGSYLLYATETLEGVVGKTVEAAARAFEGYTYDASVEGNKASGTLINGTPLELKLYYTLLRKVSYVADGMEVRSFLVKNGEMLTEIPAVPTKEGFSGAWDIDLSGVAIKQSYVVTAVYTTAILYGDANCDGSITSADAAYVLRYSVKLSVMTEQGLLNADVDGKAGVTTADAAAILRYTVKLEKQLPIAYDRFI